MEKQTPKNRKGKLDLMADFKIIETQEELDKIIGERISRERKSIAEKYADYDAFKAKATELEAQVEKLTTDKSELEEKLKANADQINGLSSKIATYETDSVKTRVALEMGLPYELATRLNGVTEEDIRKDAENIKGLMKISKVAPVAQNETPPVDLRKQALLELAQNLK